VTGTLPGPFRGINPINQPRSGIERSFNGVRELQSILQQRAPRPSTHQENTV
jgi:hypothetical protein